MTNWLEASTVIAAALAAFAAWRASRIAEEGTIRAAAEQREAARARRLEWIERAHRVLSEMLILVERGQTETPRWQQLVFELRWLDMVLNRMQYDTQDVSEIFAILARHESISVSAISDAITAVEAMLGSEFPAIVDARPASFWRRTWDRLLRRGAWGVEARVTRERERWTPAGRGRRWR